MAVEPLESLAIVDECVLCAELLNKAITAMGFLPFAFPKSFAVKVQMKISKKTYWIIQSSIIIIILNILKLIILNHLNTPPPHGNIMGSNFLPTLILPTQTVVRPSPPPNWSHPHLVVLVPSQAFQPFQPSPWPHLREVEIYLFIKKPGRYLGGEHEYYNTYII